MNDQDNKPFSQACENNKRPILNELIQHFANVKNVLEIGSGTGQHAVYFAPNLPNLTWQTADQIEYHQAILSWIKAHPSPNLNKPLALSIPQDDWPTDNFDGIYTANTAHIMLKQQVIYMMRWINEKLPKGGVFCQYGPFTVNGEFTSQSNADFHHKLIDSGRGGYRDIDELKLWAPALSLEYTKVMPANNFLLVWRKY